MRLAGLAFLAAVAMAAAGCGSGSKATPGPPAKRGQLLEAPQVQVVAYPDGTVLICPPYIDDGVYGPPTAPSCRGGLKAEGIQVDGLHDHLKGVRWGRLHLLGVYRDGTFWVRAQSPWRVAPNPYSPFEGPIPCRPPGGGWRIVAPTDAQRATIAAYQRAHRGDLVSVSFFRGGTILVVASSHPARTRAGLARAWPRQICIVRARYSRAFVNRLRMRVIGLMRPMSRSRRYGWVTGAGGYGVNGHGETTISLSVLLETPELRAFLRRLPHGIVTVDSEFRPATAGQA
jgi:hypothetical protein